MIQVQAENIKRGDCIQDSTRGRLLRVRSISDHRGALRFETDGGYFIIPRRESVYIVADMKEADRQRHNKAR